MKEGYVAMSSQSQWLEPEKALVVQGLSGDYDDQIPTLLRQLEAFGTINWSQVNLPEAMLSCNYE